MLDLVIKNGTVVDGTGAPRRRADVGIAGEVIVAVGGDLPEAARTLDAAGHVVAPGFVDVHTHSDFSLFVNRNAESSIHQGVTTELVGNCGFSAAPIVRPEDLPLVATEYVPGVDVRWRSFGEYLDALEGARPSINVAALVGHGAVRLAGMGNEMRPATADEVAKMEGIVADAMDAGAFGFSSGLEYNPGKNATPDELAALVRVAGARGGIYTTHIRNRDYRYMAAIREAIDAAEQSGTRLQISHISPRWGVAEGAAEEALHSVDQAKARGLDVGFDNHPYIFGRGLTASCLPAWAFQGGVDGLRQRLADPAERARMRDNDNPQWKHVHQGRWDLLMIYDAPANRALQGRTIESIAAERGCAPWDVVFDLLLDEGDNPYGLLWSAPIHRQEDVDMTFLHPDGAIMSDGSAVAPYGPYRDVKHIYAYGWATHFLRRYVRERKLIPLEDAVRRMTSLPASRIGLRDRGAIAVGQKADIVIFDAETVTDRATFENPIAFPSGVRDVLVNGTITLRGGEHTGAWAGAVLRRNR